VIEKIRLERKDGFNKTYELVDKLIEEYGEENIVEFLCRDIKLEWQWEIIADLFAILIWSLNDATAISLIETTEQWLLEGSDIRKIKIALHLDVFPFRKKEQMQTVLSSLARLYPEISQHCFHLIASRN